MSNPVVKPQIRNQILRDHLQQVSLKQNNPLAAGLTFETAIGLFGDDPDDEVHDQTLPVGVLNGGLTKEDLMRHEFTPLRIDPHLQAHLRDSLRQTLHSLLDFWVAGEGQTDVAAGERDARALVLPSELQTCQTRLQELRTEISTLRSDITDHVKEINQIHPRLENLLVRALDRFLPSIHTERTLRSEVLANTIETCLLKLSLMRHRLYAATYGLSGSSGSPPPLTMSAALTRSYHTLRQRETAQQEEEREIDAQLAEYDAVVALFGGGRGRGGGFGQVVDDMARVRRETDECRKDLRRLGWTGD